MRVACVVGARPNFMKVAPILAELRDDTRFTSWLVHTGQHYDAAMSEAFFRDLELPRPDTQLDVGSDRAAVQTATIMLRLVEALDRFRPDLVMVVGDVTSTLAAALTAVKMGIPLAHVEAGLRSFDRAMPEEINRIVVDAVADICFTTEPSGNEHLRREGVDDCRIHHVGNVMIDTLFRFRERAAGSRILETLGVTTGAFAVLTLHRPSNVDDPRMLTELLGAVSAVAADVPVVFPVHPRTRPRLHGMALATGVRDVDPLPYLDFVHLMAHASCVLTDSGGIQEETTALGVPCLTLRTTTERPVTITHGTNRLVGVDPTAIVGAWKEIRRGHWSHGELPPLWDGKAAKRIVDVLRGRLE